MGAERERTGWTVASEIFDALGVAVGTRATYGESHPRFASTLERLSALLAEFFQRVPEAAALPFAVNRDDVEFQTVPLVDLSPLGRKLAEILRTRSVGIVQIERAISPPFQLALVKELGARSSSRPGNGGDPSPNDPLPYRLIDVEEAKRILAARKAEPAKAFDQGLPDLAASEEAIEKVLASYHSLLRNAEQGIAFDYESLRDTVAATAKLFGGRSAPILGRVKRAYFDDFTFHHSVNVSLISTHVARMVIRDEDLVTSVSIAALLHDVGKTRVDREIILKPGKLTRAEMEEMRRHPMLGAEMLLGTKGVDPLAVGVAFGHHCNESENSYPRTRHPYPPDWITRLVSVVDVYEALTAIRPYKKALASEEAFQVIVTMPGMQDRLPVVKLLYDVLGPYPVGAVVELSTGERAVVLEQNAADPKRPRIRIVTDASLVPYPLPREVDLLSPDARSGARELRIKKTVVVQARDEDPVRTDRAHDANAIFQETLRDRDSIFAHEA